MFELRKELVINPCLGWLNTGPGLDIELPHVSIAETIGD
jgi:hypothetical protein